jgi:hypothetical protein
MKKTWIVIGICSLLLALPTIPAVPYHTTKTIKPICSTEEFPTLPTPSAENYDGTFVGAFGVIYKENDEWANETWGYLAGVYKGGNRKRLYGNIYNLDEEQIGTIGAFFGQSITIGRIENMNGEKAPIIGFLFYNEDYFVGRIMSFFGPAPHLWGIYTPN